MAATGNYAKLVRNNLSRLYDSLPSDLEHRLPAAVTGDEYRFSAFGESCRLSPSGVHLGDREEWGVRGILITLYALHARNEPQIVEPLKSFKDFPNSMPYVGAFATHTESILAPSVTRIQNSCRRIESAFNAEASDKFSGGDFSLAIRPLPKISLFYVFYHADEDFSASATCLFSSNADRFMPLDALADVGELTSRKILELIK